MGRAAMAAGHLNKYISRVKGSRVTMPPLCASVLAHPMKPSCSIEQGGVTQPHSEGNITGPIANILYGEVVKKEGSNTATNRQQYWKP